MTHPEHAPDPIRADPRLTDAEAAAEARRIIEDAYRPAPTTPTAYRDTSPLPAYGSALPVPQPGLPPMSQRATDASRLMLTAGLATVPPGLIAIGLLIASRHADPTVIALLLGAPAVPILALTRLLRRAKDAMPPEIHNHYTGPVYQDQRNLHTTTRGVWAKTTNQQ
ncbi:hypothetical protein [Streptomyces camelliae]|uniref:Uncharacterized protein n=1 Tax=Streptomyces camelliae TaxID=3004093 RepID=A0ABY7P247_9ACTN|nr:hypothetical protein [Streptomyces sp. HUAS 2-6]WBO64477.1 hypothetical protein O1G22_17370 [Streptomyces sp. HUAS 2-6]